MYIYICHWEGSKYFRIVSYIMASPIGGIRQVQQNHPQVIQADTQFNCAALICCFHFILFLNGLLYYIQLQLYIVVYQRLVAIFTSQLDKVWFVFYFVVVLCVSTFFCISIVHSNAIETDVNNMRSIYYSWDQLTQLQLLE